MPRPNRLIRAMKQKNFRDFVWEALLHEYRCAKMGDSEHRLGPNALSSLVAALRELEQTKATMEQDTPNVIEIDNWVKSVKNNE
jgi:hypothetical protein